MATTTNFGWTTPDDTALVKDGASAIRTLGSSIDTTTKNLNPSTTLGDIEYRSSTANTNTRLAIGTTGQVLTVSGGVPSWATPTTAGGMTLLSTTSLSGTSTSITGISGSYNDLRVVIEGYTFNSESRIQLTLNSDTTTDNYRGGGFKVEYGTPALTTPRFSSTSIGDPGGEPFGSTGYARQFILNIYDYANSSSTKLFQTQSKSYYETSGYYVTGWAFGYWGNSAQSAVTSIQIKSSNGTSTWSAGTVKIYGVK